jgi:hypothetical protein
MTETLHHGLRAMMQFPLIFPPDEYFNQQPKKKKKKEVNSFHKSMYKKETKTGIIFIFQKNHYFIFKDWGKKILGSRLYSRVGQVS